MGDYAIRVEEVGKKYRLRRPQDQHRYVALRDVIAAKAKHLASAFRLTRGSRQDRAGGPDRIVNAPSKRTEDFWALKNVSFEVKPGDVIGIIGRNGAGKSTLLKILSRITEPTLGRARLRGRIASLLEVGTGFHPELTGRENVFLNGAILGMTKVEITRRFDEIVAFAEVEQFLDTPVKHYSSGMYVRLAFAVAAHLEPETLIVDEVLSVGDVAFQMKCLGKLRDVSVDGRTVLYVTHNLASVTSLCKRGIVLSHGEVVEDSTVERAVNSYLQLAVDRRNAEPHVLFVNQEAAGDRYDVTRIEMLDQQDRPKTILRPMEFVKLRISFTAPVRLPQGSIVIEVTSIHGTVVLKLESNPRQIEPLSAGDGVRSIDCVISSLPLMEGRYVLSVGLAIYGVRLLTWIADAATLLISEPAFDNRQDMSVNRKGLLVVDHEWRLAGQASADSGNLVQFARTRALLPQ